MKKLLCFVFLVNTYLTLFGQDNISNDTIHWKKDRLSWDDFKGEAIEGIGMLGEAFCMNLANFEKPNMYQKTKFDVVAIFDRTKSWVDTNNTSEIGLIYFQVMFNIYEVHARLLKKELANTKFGMNPNSIFQEKYNASMTNLMNEFNLFRRETKMGSDVQALMSWKLKVDEELLALEKFKN